MIRLITALFLVVSLVNISDAQVVSEKIVPLFTLKTNHAKPPEGYGLSADKPLLTGVFKGPVEGMMTRMIKFYSSFTWLGGETLDFSKRGTARSLSGGILDCYTLIRPGTTDTIKLYADPYNEGEIFLPKGLAFSTSKFFAPQVMPVIRMIDDLNNMRDPYADSAAKNIQARVLYYLQNSVGFDFFYDAEIISKLMSDKSISSDLSGFLFRNYLFGTFRAYAKGSGNERSEGMETMKKAWKDATTLHPELRNEGLEKWLGSK